MPDTRPDRLTELAIQVEHIAVKLDRVIDGQAELKADVKDLKVGQAELNQRVGNLEAGQAKLEAGQAKLEAGQAKLEERVGNLEAGQARLEAGQVELKAGQDHIVDVMNANHADLNRKFEAIWALLKRRDGE